MQFKGKVEDVAVREFTKKDGTNVSITSIVVKETEGEYPQMGVFEMSDKITTRVSKGDIVAVDFNMSARQGGANWYHTNRAWRVDKADSAF